jgi:uncharacterized protein (TIGR02001 family)
VLTATAGDRIGGSVGVTSDYRLDGLSLSRNKPAVQAELHLQARTEDGGAWFGGIWASTVRTGHDESSVQIEGFFGRQWSLNPDWQTSLMLAHYTHPWNGLLKHYDYDELTVEASFRDRLKLTAAYSPNTDLYSHYGFVENRKSIAWEATASLPVRHALSASAGLGFRDLGSFFDSGYWYGSAGLAYDRANLHASLMRIQTDQTARRLFYSDIVEPAWVGTLLWTF